MARRFDAVIFDMDGLLLDSERPIRDAWLRLSSLTEADYLLTVGRNRPDSLAVLTEKLGSLAEAERVYAAVDAEIAAQFQDRGFELKPGALALLQRLQGLGVPLAVASSTRHAKVLDRLDAAGIRPFFGPIHGGDQVARGKPHPDLFELAARSLGIHPAKTLVFEDSSYGAQGALTAGMGVVLVPDLKQPDPAIAPQCLVLGSLDEVLPRLPSWFRDN
ncbi:HAD family phosphatase [Paucibacter sp. O1-1]|uniref:HAD family hydrolase n=1 Tax=Paucibacter sp. M5-1 TaxID=3015998 RepID=UPI0021D4F5C1|nr:HAD family phosphatase [Paucibacter sp. M5-1]MCU7373446.1 HAD family phosphatase [Paucibacter sp. O1-1]MCZ7879740.1 HAD family phosphatase [Paucibacter sp. M5-1]MDA3828446.1 HAD family phosphatase [Paucibacter sp. O1-1]